MTAAILVYHRIVDGPASHIHELERTRFVQHLEALRDLGARAEAGAMLRLPGGRGVVLSFDDGTADHRAAAELLEAYGWRGLFFVPAGRLGEPGRLTGGDVRALVGRGHVVGAHGHSHRRFDRLSEAELDDELERGSLRLADACSAPVTWLAPPGGLCPAGLEGRARRFGYLAVRSIRWGYAGEPLLGMLPALPVTARTTAATVRARALGHAPLWPGHLKERIKAALGEATWEAVRRWYR